VVEDDPDLRQLNAGVLIHSGYAVDVAEDGAAALGSASCQPLRSSDHRQQHAQADRH
jgi:DNA-binding response OmpR family regulator